MKGLRIGINPEKRTTNRHECTRMKRQKPIA